MPYLRPTLTALQSQVQQDINASPIGLIGFLRNAVLPILGWAMAGLAYEHYAFQDYIALQAVPWTATEEWLFGWAALKGVYQEDATASTGSVAFTGTVSAGTTIPVDTLITRADGTQFVTTAATTVALAPVNVPVACATPGAIGNTAAGTPMTIASPIGGIISAGVANLITGGADQETQDALRTRMLAIYAAPPQGGDLNDYVEWAMGVPGVTRAWALGGGAGAGTVVVYVMLDTTEAAYGGFPQGTNGGATNETRTAAATGDQLAVANYIFPLEPVAALSIVSAPVSAPVDFTITGLGSANTSANQAAITAALQGMFLSLGYVGGTLNPVTMEPWAAITPSAWYEAIASGPGVSVFNVASPTAALTPTTGQLNVLGTVTFAS